MNSLHCGMSACTWQHAMPSCTSPHKGTLTYFDGLKKHWDSERLLLLLYESGFCRGLKVSLYELFAVPLVWIITAEVEGTHHAEISPSTSVILQSTESHTHYCSI